MVPPKFSEILSVLVELEELHHGSTVQNEHTACIHVNPIWLAGDTLGRLKKLQAVLQPCHIVDLATLHVDGCVPLSLALSLSLSRLATA